MRAIIIAAISAGACALTAQTAVGQDAKKIDAGESVYNNYCQTCHGDNLVNIGQSSYDLRKLKSNERERFERSVLNGKNTMPPWKGVLDAEQIDAVWAYVRSKANDR